MKKEVKYTKDGKEYTIFITKPNAKQLAEAQVYASKVFAKLINEEENGKPVALVRAKLMDYMVKTGLWSEEKENELISLQKEIMEKENVLSGGGIKLSEAKRIALDIRILRAKQFELVAKKNELDSHTAEGTAENARFDFLASVCLLDEEGNRLFPSVEVYKQNEDEHVYRAAFELASMISVADPNYEAKLPENKFLKEYGFIDDKLRLVNKAGHLVDSEGRLINEEGRYVAYDGETQYFVDRDGNKVDAEGNKIVEFKPFIED